MSSGGDRLREKCAVVGVSVDGEGNDAARMGYLGLFALQHRGVDASGLVATDGGPLNVVRHPGVVRDVFTTANLDGLEGSLAVGHNRYSTSGNREKHLQPVVSDAIGFAMAHNGNLPDLTLLQEYLEKRRYVTRQYNDSEHFANALASKLHGGRSFEAAMREVSELAIGAYACTATYDGLLAGFRDPHGIRPLELGEFDGGMMLASETCALDIVGAKHVRSVDPGELVLIHDGQLISSTQFAEPDLHSDVFELVYFARRDSMMRGQGVDGIRRRFGEELAKLHTPYNYSPGNTVVTAVPATSVPAAEAYAAALGARYQSVIVKNDYINRTFIQATQKSRIEELRLKHTIIPELVAGKDLVMIDDSIVRGNTLPKLVEQAYDDGARSVTVLIGSPPIRFPDFYGIDTPSQSELMAANMTVEEMRAALGADYLGFLSVSALVRATRLPRDTLNLAAFTGEYPASIGRRASTIKPPVSVEYMD